MGYEPKEQTLNYNMPLEAQHPHTQGKWCQANSKFQNLIKILQGMKFFCKHTTKKASYTPNVSFLTSNSSNNNKKIILYPPQASMV